MFSADANPFERLLSVVDLVVGTDVGKGSGKAAEIFSIQVDEIQDRVGAARKAGNVGDITKVTPEITKAYKRPSGATTIEQRTSVQGKPCVDCGVCHTQAGRGPQDSVG